MSFYSLWERDKLKSVDLYKLEFKKSRFKSDRSENGEQNWSFFNSDSLRKKNQQQYFPLALNSNKILH
jgi:hypothetical protein